MQEYLKKVQLPGQSVNPLFAFLGVIIEQISRERVVMRLPFRPDFIQGGGLIAGGIIATLADEAMAHAALANLNPGETTATIEMNIRYLKGCASGDITATASLIKKGRRVVHPAGRNNRCEQPVPGTGRCLVHGAGKKIIKEQGPSGIIFLGKIKIAVSIHTADITGKKPAVMHLTATSVPDH